MGYITLSKEAFFNNASYYSNLLGGKEKLCMALKDNAYGHGITYMGQMCQEYGIKHTIVRDVDEANIASQYDFDTILVLYDKPIQTYPSNYIFSINSLEQISSYSKNSKIELKIDTGMSRNGICISQIDEALALIEENDLLLNGVFTHFCCADEENDKTQKQEQLFLKAVEQIKLKVKIPFRIHCSNTAGAHKVNHDLYDMGRIGIGMYGYSQPAQDSLKQILSLWANKISTRTLIKDDTIGYGGTYKIQEDNMIVSNYDIGYGDGFFRINERQTAYIQNKKQILGRVSMDSFSLEGDEDKVCVFDNATHLTNIHDTIEYEILTHLLPRVKRMIV